MPSPKIRYSELDLAFHFGEGYGNYSWLDRTTGQVITYGEDAMFAIREGNFDDLPKWLKDEVEGARMVLRALGESSGEDEEADEAVGQAPDDAVDLDRFIRIEQISSDEAFRFMEDFTNGLRNSRAVQELTRALRGGKPFRRFKDALSDFPKEREQWFKYDEKRRREYIEEWASDHDIEIDFSSDAP